MSTMYDALKKAEEERKRTAGLEKTGPTGTEKNGGKAEYIKIAVLLTAVLIVFGIAFYRIKASLVVPKPVIKIVPITPAVKFVPPPPPYVLNGIIEGKDPMAVINNKLLKFDDTIDDLILKKISPDEVELLNTKDNSTVVLKIN